MGTFGLGELICTYKYCERRFSPVRLPQFGRQFRSFVDDCKRQAVDRVAVRSDRWPIIARSPHDTRRPRNFLERANYFRVMLNSDSLHSLQEISLPSRNLALGDRLGFFPLRKMIV
jgi:hypothetical protein